MTPEELPGYLAKILVRVAASSVPAVRGMADAYQDYLVRVTLRRYAHGPGVWTTSPPGQPPAWVSGNLARSVERGPMVAGPASASVKVYPTAIYSRIQELGGHIEPVRGKYLHFLGPPSRLTPTGAFFLRGVTLPPRPYMRPTTEETVDKGILRRAAVAGFEAFVWGRL